MNLSDHHAIKSSARQTLFQAGQTPKKLVLLYGAVSGGVFLITFLVNVLLMQQIEHTGGLSGMQTRSILSSIQVILRYASALFMLFWQVGFVHVAMGFAKGQSAQPKSLLEGFRHAGSVVGITLIESLIMMAVGMALTYLSVFIFALTPMSRPMYAVLEPLLEQGENVLTMDTALIDQMMGTLWPAVLLFGILFLILGVPLLYRFRMSRYCLMDDPSVRAFGAVRFSVRAMRQNRMKLFKLDLSFWWYYLLQILVLATAYGDLILSNLGISLPLSAEGAYILFYVLYLVLQFGLTVWAATYVQTSYSRFYLELKEESLRQQTQVIVQNQPWDNPQQ